VTDRPAVDKAQQDVTGIGPQLALAADGVGLGISLGEDLFHQSQGCFGGPAMPRGVGQPTPPGLIGEAHHPVGVLGGQLHEPIAPVFFGHTADRGW
jgi:hypothetical protein